MKRKLASVALMLSITLISSLAHAEWSGWKGSGGWGMNTPYQKTYNPTTAETISGVVESVEKNTPLKGMHSGIHLTVKTDKESIPVSLGPVWYIERLDTKIKKGDKIEVKGSKVSLSGKPTIIAGEIKKDDSTITLRDSEGVPAWSGWRR